MQTFNLDLSKKEIVPLLHVKQKDVGAKISITITDNGKAYTIPSGSSFSVWFSGKSGNGNYSKIGNRSAFSAQGSTVTVELILQMLNNPGEHLMCLVMNDANGNQIGLWNIPYCVEELPGANSEPATKYFENLEAAQEAADRAVAAAESVEGLQPLFVTIIGNTKASHTAEEIASRADNGGAVYLRVADIDRYLSLSYHTQDEATFAHIGENGIVTSYVIERDGGVRTWSFDLNNGGGGGGGGFVEPLIVTLSEDGGMASHDPLEIKEHIEIGGSVYLQIGGAYFHPSYVTESEAYFHAIYDDGIVDLFEITTGFTVYRYELSLHGNTPIKGEDYWTEEDKAEMVADVIAALPVYNGEVV